MLKYKTFLTMIITLFLSKLQKHFDVSCLVNLLLSGSPGLLVMGGTCWSWVRIPAPYYGWIFSHKFVVKINEKGLGIAHSKKLISSWNLRSKFADKGNSLLLSIFTLVALLWIVIKVCRARKKERENQRSNEMCFASQESFEGVTPIYHANCEPLRL